MRNYQRKLNNPYKLPHNLYMRMLYLIKDYSRIQAERAEVYHASSKSFSGTGESVVMSVTENKAMQLTGLDEDCEAVEGALAKIPPEYRKGLIENICNNAPYPYTASYATYSRWRQRLIYWVAANLGKI